MAFFLAPVCNSQIIDANGNPLVGGFIYTYLAGSTTPVATYTSNTGGTPQANPIVLNSLGLPASPIWLQSGLSYKFVVKDASLVTLETLDNIAGINDSATQDQWTLYAGTPTYVSATSFTLAGDQTNTFQIGRRVKSTNTGGTVYSTIVNSVYGSPNTTVTVVNDSGALDSGLSSVSLGLITATSPSLPGTLTAPPFRNRIINGSFRTDQRNSGASQTLTAGAAVAYTVDRMYASCTGANVTIQRVAGTGYKNAVTITGAASNTATLFGQRVESFSCYDWANRQVNVQIPISAVGITTLTWNAYTADVADVFSAKTLIATGNLTLSGTVDTKYFSFAAGANAARGIAIEFVTGALVAGQSITYQGAFQAEAGQVSPFEVMEIGDDLRRCMRYYEAGSASQYGYGLAGTTNAYRVAFKVTKRAVPTLTYGVGTTTNVSTFDAINADTGSLLWRNVTTATGGFVWDGVWAAAAEL
jgi:hypothetical protein